MPATSTTGRNFPTILTLSGWGQTAEALVPVLAPLPAEAVDYAPLPDAQSVFTAIAAKQPQILLGWSLGGQLAVRAVAAGVVRPKLLVLLGAPFQFIRSRDIPTGMPSLQFSAFEQGFALMPGTLLQRFTTMMTFQDSNAKEIAKTIRFDERHHPHWARWLEELRQFSCLSLDFSTFPRTLIIQGERDIIVNVQQASLFAERIPNCRVVLLPTCGHAPHLHAPERLRQLIEEEA